ncbi:MAG: phosphoglycerate dehydrogenase [Anaerolineae bacterium]|nr:phosphoglycerate dehydrogenase [Anaerolineae bacterium]
MSRVILCAALAPEGIALLENASDIQLIQLPPDPAQLTPHLAGAQAIISGDDLPISQALLDQAPQLSLIGRVGASLGNIAMEAATRRGIIVMNTPGVDAVTVAEYTLGLLLALVRDIVPAHAALAAGRFDRAQHSGAQLQGKTLGVIGLGRVGREVAQRAAAFGMPILAADPYVPESAVSDLRVKLVGVDEVLSQADILTLHTTVLPNTSALINVAALARLKPGAWLVNVKDARLMDDNAVLAALQSGHLSGLAADVLAADSPLVGHPRVVHTLRMRDNTHEARQDSSRLIAQQVLDALRGQDYRNAVNLPFMSGHEFERLQPQLHLAERIGALQHALGQAAPIQRVSIDVRGEEMQDLIKPLTVGILRGLLAPALGEQVVNYINAPVLAAERGIHVTQTKGLHLKDYPNLLSCQVHWSNGSEIVIAGALFNQTEPRIVQVDRYRTDFTPEGVLLVMGSYDVPGVIGRVGTFMAEHGINIASWRTSRAEKGGNTLSVIAVDEPLDAATLTALREQEFVRHLRQLLFI